MRSYRTDYGHHRHRGVDHTCRGLHSEGDLDTDVLRHHRSANRMDSWRHGVDGFGLMGTPYSFPWANRILKGPEGSDIVDLPTYADGEGHVSCWLMSDEEIAEIVRTGCVWLWVIGGQPPVCVMGESPFIPSPDKDIEDIPL